MRVKRLIWTVVFLGVTLVAIVMECVAGLWHPAGWTIPWTEYLARYVPWPVQLAAYVILAVWLPFHFWRHDHLRGVAYQRGYVKGLGKQHATQEELLYDAWNLIANAGWDAHRGLVNLEKSPGWHEAALRWRDGYHAHLGRTRDVADVRLPGDGH